MLHTIARRAPLTLAAAALTFSLQTRNQDGATEAAKEGPLRLRTLEIVDGDGHVALRLGSNEHGGTLELFRPSGEQDPVRFGFVGCTDAGRAVVEIHDPERPESASIALGVEGDPAQPFLAGGRLSSGASAFALGGADTSEGVLRIYEPGEKGVLRFAR